MRLDPRRLLELLAVARHGSLSGAAESIGVSQPALSQSIAVLEHGLGVRVLDRDRHGARLTEFGKTLVFHAQALESLLDRAKVDTRLRSLGVEGLLALGITPITAVGLVPIALESLLRDTPNVSVSVVEDLDDRILSMLRARELDLVISRLGVGPDYPDVKTEPLLLADWSLILRSEHPLASLSSVSLKDLDGVKWVLPAGGSAFRRQLENMFATAGIGWPTRAINTNSILAIKAIVMSSDCVTIMSPRLVEVEREIGRISTIALTDVGPLRPVGLMWRANDELSPIAARFADVLRRVARGSAA
ncbi:MAG: LysR family transcriptional regulator [Sulfuritalea sp.]|nr:LysR family transcriptional regulator [Sulfuritalea sp.]